ncbi:hypothetical protein ACFL6D_00795 [Spirochaetota bacterium]
MKVLLTLSLMFMMLFSVLYSTWVAKIDDLEISSKEFQRFITLQKTSIGKKEAALNSLVKSESELKKILDKYIENILVLQEARKKGYNEKKSAVQEAYAKQKDEFIRQFYLIQQIDTQNIEVTEAEMKSYFEKEKKNLSPNVTYDRIKYVIYQQLMAEKADKEKTKYLKKYEKKYKIIKKNIDDYYIAIVGEEKIKKSTMEDKFSLLLSGYDKNKIPPEKIVEMKEKLRDELILEIIVDQEINKTNFSESAEVKDALKIFLDNAIIQVFIKDQYIEQTEASDEEISAEYDKNKDSYDNLGFDKALKYIKEKIKQEKAAVHLEQFLEEKKMEARIKKNYKELKNIK